MNDIKSMCGCKQPTLSGSQTYYGWFDVEGNFEGMTTDEEKEADWLKRVKIAQDNTREIMSKIILPKNKKEE